MTGRGLDGGFLDLEQCSHDVGQRVLVRYIEPGRRAQGVEGCTGSPAQFGDVGVLRLDEGTQTGLHRLVIAIAQDLPEITPGILDLNRIQFLEGARDVGARLGEGALMVRLLRVQLPAKAVHQRLPLRLRGLQPGRLRVRLLPLGGASRQHPVLGLVAGPQFRQLQAQLVDLGAQLADVVMEPFRLPGEPLDLVDEHDRPALLRRTQFLGTCQRAVQALGQHVDAVGGRARLAARDAVAFQRLERPLDGVGQLQRVQAFLRVVAHLALALVVTPGGAARQHVVQGGLAHDGAKGRGHGSHGLVLRPHGGRLVVSGEPVLGRGAARGGGGGESTFVGSM